MNCILVELDGIGVMLDELDSLEWSVDDYVVYELVVSIVKFMNWWL